MPSLPIFTTDSKDLSLLQTNWAKELNPLLKNPVSNGTLLPSILLSAGQTAVNHRLGRKLQGWVISRQRGPAAIYDNQDANPNSSLTLWLVSDTNVSVDIYVF